MQQEDNNALFEGDHLAELAATETNEEKMQQYSWLYMIRAIYLICYGQSTEQQMRYWPEFLCSNPFNNNLHFKFTDSYCRKMYKTALQTNSFEEDKHRAFNVWHIFQINPIRKI